MKMMNMQELDRHAAEVILYDWACGNIATDHAKRACRLLGFDIDFRQADLGAFIDATHIWTGETVTLEI
jgi:hypothetical protein